MIKMENKDLIEALSRYPKNYNVEYHERNEYLVADEFDIQILNRKKDTIIIKAI
jgi:hypothetical protein